MKKKHASELYASLSESSINSNNSDFEVLSLRIPQFSSAAIQAISVAFSIPVLTMLTNEISEHLAELLMQSTQNESLIIEELKSGIQSDSALDLLRSDDAIKYDDSTIRELLSLEINK